MLSAGVKTLSPVPTEPFHTPSWPSCLSLEDKFISIYLSFSGSLTPIRVMECDTIESVKFKIQRYESLPFLTNKQKLVYAGRELARSDSLLKDYGIKDGNVLHLIIKLSDLQVINVKTSCGKEFKFQVERGRDVGYIKKQIAKRGNDFADTEEQELVCKGERLEDQRVIDDICSKHNDAVVHLFVRKRHVKVQRRPLELSVIATELRDEKKIDVGKEGTITKYAAVKKVVPRKPPDRDYILEPVIVNPKIQLASSIWDMINSTYDGLDRGNYPIQSKEGTGGAYFMIDSTGQKYVSVFKPIDEEPMAVNNPRGLPLSLDGEGLKKGTIVGQGALREVAAYILDHPMSGRRALFGDGKGFAGVPPTLMVKCLHKGFNHPGDLTAKIGSMQMFMENNGSCEDMGPGSFKVKEVHKISVLDIRLANADRHAGNILLGAEEDNDQAVLIPIDHGYCLPTSFEDCTFEWLYWPQARQPYSAETIEYINSLDAEEDIALLKFHGWDLPVECACTLRISTMLLKKGAARGMTPFAIGSIMCRESLNKESLIEEIVQAAMDSILPGTSEATYMDSVSEIMNRRLDEIACSSSLL
ncbi:PREDICTED: phosphatidylinositol 4-kinase gamma 4-like [Lupinus angustifolius]|uniref:phosphatidylinositol 4-kinase gamma 4-like n=1 Tax=Lupinus angustifolius TaxID=3871 RepID=UPI00092EDBE6|nr:PREDICTED: phosphatidylinositol 4-kinase gamma 4-like [Lupinus angustifolius]XP_019440447.1 PREDICTED: phosphatidylinositol 4-kinase gamma 4-like [Lupinus angustifolius]